MKNRIRPKVVLADDEPAIVRLYEACLEGTCEVVTARDGHEVLDLVDGSVDVVLLDRRMPEMTGDEALEVLRERGYDTPVGMLSGIQPEHDIIDLPFDGYHVKPIEADRLTLIVEQLTVCAEFDDRCREFFRLATKKVVLEDAKTVDTGSSDRFQELLDRLESVQTELETETEQPVPRQPLEATDPEEFLDVVRNVCVSL